MILTIFKVIGIIILVLLSLIILILALVLLTPIRYRFSAEYFEKPDVLATVKYAFVGLNASVSYKDNELKYTIKALGGVIMTNTDAKLSWLGRKIAGGQKEDVNNSDNDFIMEDDDTINNASTDNNNDKSDKSNGIDNPETLISKNDSTDSFDTNENGEDKKKDKKSLSDTIKEKIDKLKEKYTDIKTKVSKLNKKKDSLIKVYKSKRFDKAKADVIRYIKELLKAIKPKHVEGRVHFGLDDPATTGEILGGLSTILPFYDGFLDVVPDFEKQVIEGLLKGYGKIRLWNVVKIALKVLFNKNLKIVIKRVQTIVEA